MKPPQPLRYTANQGDSPFLASVSSTATFDSALSLYVTQGYVQEK
jgi:hypothetical protein